MKSNYATLKQTYSSKENFFVGYAVEGPMVIPEYGLRAGLPVNHPIPGPVSEPSPLNNRDLFQDPYKCTSKCNWNLN